MKNYIKPISMTFMATVMFASSAHAGILDVFKPKGGGIGNILRPGNKNPQNPGNNPAPPSKDYGVAIPASPQINQAVISALQVSRQQIGQTAIDLKNLREIYALHGNRAFWVNDNGLSNMGYALQDMLSTTAEFHGLESNYYLTQDVNALLAKLQSIVVSRQANSLAELDLLLTQGYILFVKDMTTGRINPRDPNQNLKDIEMKKHAAPSMGQLNAITTHPDALFDGVLELAPKLNGYAYLIESLAKINDGIRAGGWSSLDTSKAIRKGDTHPNVIGVRQRLVDFGYLPQDDRNNRDMRFDAKLDEAVRRFQENNFLGVDGVVGNGAYKILAQPVEKFKNQIRANIEKWRFHPRSFPKRYMMVDMGRQQLDVIQDDRLVIRMNTVVGKDVNGTPTMTDKVTSVLLAPYWHSPKSIMVKETIPRMGSNPAKYLADRNVEVLDASWRIVPPEVINSINWNQYTMENPPPYTFREENGPTASLGLVKFNLTNGHSIYLHDTNNPGAFKQRVRYLSHGCIRLERPFDLVAYLLNGTVDPQDSIYWHDQAANIANLMEEQRNLEADLKANVSIDMSRLTELRAMKLKPEEIPVSDQLPVFIFGSTTVNYADGSIGFGEDAYKQDERIIQALDQMANARTAAAAIQQGQ